MKQTIIVINRHVVRSNKRTGVRRPPIRVSNGRHGKPSYHAAVKFSGATGRLVYDPDNPLPCGATVWLEVYDNSHTGGDIYKIQLDPFDLDAGGPLAVPSETVRPSRRQI